MHFAKLIAALGLIASLHLSPALAQTDQVQSATNLVPLRFRAQGRAVDETRGRVTFTRLTERDIIAQSLGITNRAPINLGRNFLLAYDPAADRIQVFSTSNAAPVADVLLFQGGAFTSDLRTSTRLAFMFLPGVTNPIGTVLMTERAPQPDGNLSAQRSFIRGQMQFTLTGNAFLGAPPPETNALPVSTNAVPSAPVTGIDLTTPLAGTTTGQTALGGGTSPTIGGTAPVQAPAAPVVGAPGVPVVSTPVATNTLVPVVVTNAFGVAVTNALGVVTTNAQGVVVTNIVISNVPDSVINTLPGPSSSVTTTNLPSLPVAGFSLGGTNGPFFLTTSSLLVTNNTANVRIYTGTFESNNPF